ncbi:aldo/keto reductase [Roseibacillus persicicus]|uniref:aldo/keto reductase n=1 Tax=Roseibacillus persicicus TaxID=454148 RepID=UPI001672B2E1|nr:aldo/keto reductase [Roseibacillus persicicus]
MSHTNESRRGFFKKSAVVSAELALAPALLAEGLAAQVAAGKAHQVEPEWRNRQEGMSYRMLGRTGMMVSEIVMGTFPFTSAEYFPALDKGIEKGMNYIDTASAYSNGQVEATIGSYFQKQKNRDQVFLATKISGYYGFLENALKEVAKGMSSGQVEAIRKKADEMIAERDVLKPGYHMDYFGGQSAQFGKAYFRHLMLQEHGYQAGWRKKIKERAHVLLEESLKRLQTDHVDVLHCPHGVAMPELLEDDLLSEVFAEFKKKGMIRAAGVSFHNDVAANLSAAIKGGFYDVTMFAYNIANHAALENLMFQGKQAGVGMIAMKVAKLFALENQPDWRKEKLELALPEKDLSIFAKSYLWALQNSNLSCCVSQMETPEIVLDNSQVVGKTVEVRPV